MNNSTPDKQVVTLFSRETKSHFDEQVYERGFMDFFYGDSWMGRLMCEAIIKRKWFSRFYGYWQRRAASKDKIFKFIQQYDIDLDEIEKSPEHYSSFDDFFCRKLKPGARPICQQQNALVSVADARLLALPINKNSVYPVKGKAFSLQELLPSFTQHDQYANGTCLIFRLAPCDYHRFIYFDDGDQGPIIKQPGHLHSVNPLALMQQLCVFTGNLREFCTVESKNFGAVVQIDVGALTVGRIVQHKPTGGACIRGEEKGFFRIGGSTIILLFKEGYITLDQDIRSQSELGIETIVKLGEKIGTKL